MADDGRSLYGMLAKVPRLLSSCVPHCWEGLARLRELGYSDDFERSNVIRALRLVSKDVGGCALQEVKQCSVQLGVGASPEPRQILHVLRCSRLESIRVTIVTSSARGGPLLAQQLAACTSQAEDLVQGMGAALRSVTELTLAVEHTPHRGSRSRNTPEEEEDDPCIASCPASYAVITRTVCTRLAAALPGLSSIKLVGCCRDAAFEAFGRHCPMLSCLEVEAITVPIRALASVGQHLRSLESFTLGDPQRIVERQQLSDYVGASLRALRTSVSLTTFLVRFTNDYDMYVQCKPRSWDQVPASLRRFGTFCDVRGILNATALLQNLHTLELYEPRGSELFRVLEAAPGLKRLSVEGLEHYMVQCNHADTIPGVSLLRERMLGGLEPDIELFGLEGSCANVQAVLEVLPSFASTAQCTLELYTIPGPHTLERVAHVWPNIVEVDLRSLTQPQDDPGCGVEILTPLAACEFLEGLKVEAQLSYTVAELEALCVSMPSLRYLCFSEIDRDDRAELSLALVARGLDIYVSKEMSRG
ncbi:MAG: hypothetical protein WDW38_004165 [Sanguina aurantia]